MSASISPSTGLRYGVRRVCRIWGEPRATVYLRRQVRPEPQRRGPKPLVPDAVLLPWIQEDLANSPFREEGHRKVYYRLKFVRKVKVAPKRILRLMRENSLLSPQRAPQGEPNTHDGTILTKRPLELWGTDGTTVQVVEEGTVWIFGAVEHFNAECVGIHASKSGDRFNAMEPIKQGLRKHYGAVSKGVAAGLAVRSDHGSQYVSDYFQRELGLRRPPEPRLRRRAPDQWGHREVLEDPQETDHRGPDLPDPGGPPEGPGQLHGPLQPRLALGKARRAHTRRGPPSLGYRAGSVMLISGLNNRARYSPDWGKGFRHDRGVDCWSF